MNKKLQVESDIDSILKVVVSILFGLVIVVVLFCIIAIGNALRANAIESCIEKTEYSEGYCKYLAQ